MDFIAGQCRNQGATGMSLHSSLPRSGKCLPLSNDLRRAGTAGRGPSAFTLRTAAEFSTHSGLLPRRSTGPRATERSMAFPPRSEAKNLPVLKADIPYRKSGIQQQILRKADVAAHPIRQVGRLVYRLTMPPDGPQHGVRGLPGTERLAQFINRCRKGIYN